MRSVFSEGANNVLSEQLHYCGTRCFNIRHLLIESGFGYGGAIQKIFFGELRVCFKPPQLNTRISQSANNWNAAWREPAI